MESVFSKRISDLTPSFLERRGDSDGAKQVREVRARAWEDIMVLAGNQSKRCSEEAASAGSLPSPPLTLRRDKGKERDAEGLPVTLLPYVSDIFRV